MWISSQWKWKSLSRVQLFATPWTIQSMQFSRPEYWNGQVDSLPAELPRKPSISIKLNKIKKAQFRFGPRTVVGSSRWLSYCFSCCVYPLNELKGIRISALQVGKIYHTTLESRKCVVTGPCVCMELIKTPFLIQARLILSAPQSQHHDVVQLGRPGAALTRIRWSRTLYPWGGKDLRVDTALKQNVQSKALLGQPCESRQILEFAKRMKENYSALSPTPATARQVLTRDSLTPLRKFVNWQLGSNDQQPDLQQSTVTLQEQSSMPTKQENSVGSWQNPRPMHLSSPVVDFSGIPTVYGAALE